MQKFSVSNIELKLIPLRKNMYFLGCPVLSQKITLSQSFNISSLVFARMSIDNRVLGQYANLDFRIWNCVPPMIKHTRSWQFIKWEVSLSSNTSWLTKEESVLFLILSLKSVIFSLMIAISFYGWYWWFKMNLSFKHLWKFYKNSIQS